MGVPSPTPITWVTGQRVTAAQLNQQIRDAALASVVQQYSAAGQMAFGAGALEADVLDPPGSGLHVLTYPDGGSAPEWGVFPVVQSSRLRRTRTWPATQIGQGWSSSYGTAVTAASLASLGRRWTSAPATAWSAGGTGTPTRDEDAYLLQLLIRRDGESGSVGEYLGIRLNEHGGPSQSQSMELWAESLAIQTFVDGGGGVIVSPPAPWLMRHGAGLQIGVANDVSGTAADWYIALIYALGSDFG